MLLRNINYVSLLGLLDPAGGGTTEVLKNISVCRFNILVTCLLPFIYYSFTYLCIYLFIWLLLEMPVLFFILVLTYLLHEAESFLRS